MTTSRSSAYLVRGCTPVLRAGLTFADREPRASLGVSALPEDRFSVSNIQVTCQALFHTDASRFNYMEPRNHTDVSEFLLLGWTEDPELQPLLFRLFLSMYLVTILGNLLVILAFSSDPHLHTPMYFFLSNLSLADVGLSTTTIPKMLVNIQAQNQHISYSGCIAQIGIVMFFGGCESCLLAAMAYGCYMAICHPLRYMVIKNRQLCVLLILLSLLLSTGVALILHLMVSWLSFFKDLEFPHFFCELPQVIKLACSDTLVNYILIYFAAGLCAGVPVSGIIFSYAQIISSILRIP
ncbi:Olfactory Receptor 7G1 [Manis pentadactyla]|nr:Olfactory Receptor 7G1 [Manis pentadactyla]